MKNKLFTLLVVFGCVISLNAMPQPGPRGPLGERKVPSIQEGLELSMPSHLKLHKSIRQAPAKRLPAATYSGTCGTNLQWSLDTSAGVLTITGSGAMDDFEVTTDDNGTLISCTIPWYDYRENIISVSLPEGITRIGNYAFYCCFFLTTINIPNSVENIGSYAFCDCHSLTSVTIPNSVTGIGVNAFNMVPNIVYNGTASESPWGARSLNGYVDGWLVYNNSSKTEVLACSSAASGAITIPSSVVNIVDLAFIDCGGITSVTIPSSVISIGNYAFMYCVSLTSLAIPNSVTSIGDNAFYYCVSLISVTIPSSVTSIGDLAFYGCNNLPVVDHLRYADTYLVGVADSISAVTLPTYTIKPGTKWVGAGAFGACTGLTSIEIPNNVMRIGYAAFYGCTGLTSVTIPNSVKSIGNYAFIGCENLNSMFFESMQPPVLDDEYALYTGHICAYIVPCGASKTYKQATIWSAYADLIQEIPATDYTYNITSANTSQGTVSKSITCSGVLTIEATPKSGYDFWRWSDGSQDKKRSFELTQDTTLIAYFYKVYTGTCGSNLKWSLNNRDSVLTVIGSGAMDDFEVTTDDNGKILSSTIPWLDYVENITSVSLPEGITGIGDYAFLLCTNITFIDIPNSVTSIGDYAFYGCTSLTSVAIPNSVTSIGGYAFCRCTGLTSVTIPNSVTSIGEGAFSDCTGLTSIKIPNSVTNIGDYTFRNCTSITSIEIPNSVTNIGDYAFEGCTGLTSVAIPGSVTSMGCGAFYNCTSLTFVTIPESVTSIGMGGTFQKCTSLTSVQWNARNCTIDKNDEGDYYPPFLNLNTITNFSFGENVETIPDYLCRGLSGLTAIHIPNSVTSIGGSAFEDCTGLTSVTIGNSVTSIGGSAFKSCTGLTSVTIGNSVTSIGYYAFSYCTGLTSVHISDLAAWCAIPFGVGSNPLNNASNLYLNGELVTELTIPSGVTSIGNFAFARCESLTSVAIPSSVTSMGYYAFSGCTGLTTVTIGNSITYIEDYAFSQCYNLTSVTLPNSVTSIGNDAFRHCGLTSITIPNSVTIIEESAFDGCTDLTSVAIPSSVTSIGSDAFYNVRCIVYNGNASGAPWGAKQLLRGEADGNWVFENSTKQTVIGYLGNEKVMAIPSGVTTIAEKIVVYWNYSTESIEIPNGVKNIGDSAFYNCANVSSITCYSKRVPTITEHTFDGINKSTCILYVLADYLNNYVQDYYWGDFEDIRPIGAQSTPVTTTQAIPSTNSVDLSWVNVSGAATYDVILYDENGNVKCIFTFDAETGRLLNFSMAPARHRDTSGHAVSAAVHATGLSFTITSLNENTTYTYEIDAKNSNDVVIDTKTGTFTTLSPEGIEDILLQKKAIKVIRNGQVLILRGDHTYTLTGQELK